MPHHLGSQMNDDGQDYKGFTQKGSVTCDCHNLLVTAAVVAVPDSRNLLSTLDFVTYTGSQGALKNAVTIQKEVHLLSRKERTRLGIGRESKKQRVIM